MAPLFTYGVQDALGWWTHAEPGNYRDFYIWIKASWLPMELATIAAGVVALRIWRFPFLIAPIAFATCSSATASTMHVVGGLVAPASGDTV